MNEDTQQLIRSQIIAAYHVRYPSPVCRIPDLVLDGLLQSFLSGELQIVADTPTNWPLSLIVPLLQEVIQEQGLTSV